MHTRTVSSCSTWGSARLSTSLAWLGPCWYGGTRGPAGSTWPAGSWEGPGWASNSAGPGAAAGGTAYSCAGGLKGCVGNSNSGSCTAALPLQASRLQQVTENASLRALWGLELQTHCETHPSTIPFCSPPFCIKSKSCSPAHRSVYWHDVVNCRQSDAPGTPARHLPGAVTSAAAPALPACSCAGLPTKIRRLAAGGENSKRPLSTTCSTGDDGGVL